MNYRYNNASDDSTPYHYIYKEKIVPFISDYDKINLTQDYLSAYPATNYRMPRAFKAARAQREQAPCAPHARYCRGAAAGHGAKSGNHKEVAKWI